LFGGGLGGGIGAALNSGDREQGGVTGSKVGLSIPLAVAALYSKPGQKIIQKALLEGRSDRIIRIGNYLINKDYLAGLLGSGEARQQVYQPPLAE
jgi:hypothetical protein